MIKFFRQLRQQFLSENKIRKYLLYAIGEIALVMIGILLALQVNNWNQQRLRTKDEIKALEEIQEGFKADTADLNINLEALTKATESGFIILEQLNSDVAYHDSLSKHFSQSLLFTRLISQDGPYDVLKAKGLDLISNDSLRKEIIHMHDSRYESLRTFESGFFISDRFIHEQCIDLFDVIQFFEFDPNGMVTAAKMIPHDFEALKKNERYKTMIRTYATQSRFFRQYTIFTKLELTLLLQALDKELKRLKND